MGFSLFTAIPHTLRQFTAEITFVRYGFHADDAARLVQDEAELALTQREMAEATEMGIRGVPQFVFGGRLTLSGAQPLEVFRETVREAIAEARSAADATRA